MITRATTETTLLRDITTAIETQRSDDPIYRVPPFKRRAVEHFALLNGWRWDPAYHFTPEGLGKASNNYKPGGNGRHCAPVFGSPRQRKVHSAVGASQIAQAQAQRRISIAVASDRARGRKADRGHEGQPLGTP